MSFQCLGLRIKTTRPSLIEIGFPLYPDPAIVPDKTTGQAYKGYFRLLAQVVIEKEQGEKVQVVLYPPAYLFSRFGHGRPFSPPIVQRIKRVLFGSPVRDGLRGKLYKGIVVPLDADHLHMLHGSLMDMVDS